MSRAFLYIGAEEGIPWEALYIKYLQTLSWTNRDKPYPILDMSCKSCASQNPHIPTRNLDPPGNPLFHTRTKFSS